MKHLIIAALLTTAPLAPSFAQNWLDGNTERNMQLQMQQIERENARMQQQMQQQQFYRRQQQQQQQMQDQLDEMNARQMQMQRRQQFQMDEDQ